MKRIVLFMMIFSTILISKAQNNVEVKGKNSKKERKIALWGHIADSFTKVGIEGTKITLMRPDSAVIDTQTVNYFNGRTNKIDTYYRFDISARSQKFIIKAEQPDYYPTYINFEIKYVARNNYFDAPWHYMKKRQRRIDQQEHQLNEAIVMATKIKMVFKGDTVIYNADAFNLPKGSMLDDLIKQMPGVQLKNNGEIYMNGKKVEYLMLNGKEFFKGKNNVMLENLPYYTVKNIQFYNKSTDKSKYLGRDIENKEFVMDVNLKKEYSTGYTVNAELAGGTHDRNISRIFGLRYTDNTRLSVFGNMNNLSDYQRPGRDGDWSPTDAANVPVGSKKVGLDFSLDDKDQRYSDNFSADATWYNVDYMSRTSSESFLTSGTTFGRSENRYKSMSFGLAASNNFTLKKPIYLTVNSVIQHFQYDNDRMDRSATFNANPQSAGNPMQVLDSIFKKTIGSDLRNMTVNRQSEISAGSGYDTYLRGSIVATKKLSWGDNFELSLNGNYINSMTTTFNTYELTYLQNTASSDNRNKYDTNPNKSYNYNIQAEYTFHLLSNWSYLFYYIHTQSQGTQTNSIYRLDWLNGWNTNSAHSLGELPSNRDSLLRALDFANTYTKEFTEQTHKPGFRIYYEKKAKGSYTWFNLHLPLHRKNERLEYVRNLLDTCINQQNWIFQPDMTLLLQTNNYNREFRVNYNTEVYTPDMARKVNIRDDSNPLAISIGNPNLRNSIRYNLNLSFSDRNQEKQKFFNASTQLSINDMQVANGFIYNPITGVYTYKPENISGNWNINTQLKFGSAIDNEKHWSYESQSSWSYNRNVDMTAVTGHTESSISKVNNLSIDEKLKLNYQLSTLKLSAIGQAQWYNATSKRENFKTINACDFSYGMTGEYKLFKKIDVATDLKMFSRRGYTDNSLNTNNLIWNASISNSYLKGKLITRLEGFDLLQQLSNTQFIINGQGKTEIWRNSIPSYVMLHLIYRLSVNPKKK
jgi:hypothetical protein